MAGGLLKIQQIHAGKSVQFVDQEQDYIYCSNHVDSFELVVVVA
jgi:hypothetical protein